MHLHDYTFSSIPVPVVLSDTKNRAPPLVHHTFSGVDPGSRRRSARQNELSKGQDNRSWSVQHR
ncbi:unnamed protein product [Amoebophrya sp. A120]|nr:unnamed protein product [Amoebophrya sp. A120]|eukprot:GSA120T00019219001.1